MNDAMRRFVDNPVQAGVWLMWCLYVVLFIFSRDWAWLRVSLIMGVGMASIGILRVLSS